MSELQSKNCYQNASDQLTFALPNSLDCAYGRLCKQLAEKFGLRPHGRLIEGLDEIFQDYDRDGNIVGLEWDIWMGFTVVAAHPEAEPLVREIGEYLSGMPRS